MEQNRQVFFDMVDETLKTAFYSRKDVQTTLARLEQEVGSGKVNPYVAARQLLGDPDPK